MAGFYHDYSFSQEEAVLQANASNSAFPVALGAGCDHKSVSSFDVCHQVMYFLKFIAWT